MSKFNGSVDELRIIVDSIGSDGNWSKGNSDEHRFKRKDGAILAWWPSTGTIKFQGPAAEKEVFEQEFDRVARDSKDFRLAIPENGAQTIFIVHGHDIAERDALELMLRRLGLDPFILQDRDGEGLTIIEALEKRIGKNATAAFGIVLMTGDDVGYAIRDGEEKKRHRARQNVVLEMGMLLSSLTRQRVAILKQINVEHPSDADGIIYLSFDKSVSEVRSKLIQRMMGAGIEIDPKRISEV